MNSRPVVVEPQLDEVWENVAGRRVRLMRAIEGDVATFLVILIRSSGKGEEYLEGTTVVADLTRGGWFRVFPHDPSNPRPPCRYEPPVASMSQLREALNHVRWRAKVARARLLSSPSAQDIGVEAAQEFRDIFEMCDTALNGGAQEG